jgi:hypothetical protein
VSDIRSTLGSKAAAATAASTIQSSTVFVDVGARKIDANITRDGVAITALPVDRIALDDFFAGRPTVTHKVVSQSVREGTPVPVGTAIDLVLAQPSQIPSRVIEGVHVELRERTFGQIFETAIANNPDLRRVLARTGDPQVLTATDQQIVLSALNSLDVGVSSEPGRDLNAGFQALKAGMTFGT